MMGKEILKEIPEGWVELKGTMTQKLGTKWFSNGKSRFKEGFESAMVVIDEELYEEKYGKND